MTPQRFCNGGPHGKAWCGKPATVVCSANPEEHHSLAWYACAEHTEGAKTMPIEEWFNAIMTGMNWLPRFEAGL